MFGIEKSNALMFLFLKQPWKVIPNNFLYVHYLYDMLYFILSTSISYDKN